jgi:hypothetical protein
MGRYNNNNTITTSTEKRRLKTTILPSIISTNDFYIETKGIERLDKLANEFYGDVTMWWVIATANNLGRGSYVIPPGTKLRIPDIENINDILTKINQTR